MRKFALIVFAALLLAPNVWAQGRSEFRLSAGDKLKIVVHGRPDLSDEAEVGAEGSISVALIGDVAAADRTLSEIQSEIRARLEKDHMADPKVSVLMVAYKPQHIRR